MATKQEKTRDQRIRAAYLKVRRLLKNIADDKRKAAEGLMERMAFMQVTLEDLEADINEHGAVESFSQTEDIVYDRERPAARIYNTTFRNYAAAAKHLLDMLPEVAQPTAEDELMAFVKKAGR